MRTALSWIGMGLALTMAAPASAESILFVGNSFTFGANSPVMRYRPDLVRDLNREGIGGVPALFKTFAEEAGQDWTVSLETAGGRDLAYHYEQKRREIDARWDVVILQGYSTLDAQRPGDPARHAEAAGLIAAMLRRANPNVRVELVSTWSRADLTYRSPSPWRGKPIAAMAEDLAAANVGAVRRFPEISGTIPVGQAWNRAWAERVADPNPYDGIAFGQVDLWTWDQYHASAAGYYLEALVIFGKVTGFDVRRLGEQERAARDLGLDPQLVRRLQAIAHAEVTNVTP
ncbi:PEP-CTERM sorting domain-containing protein [Sphingomonas sanguinis]|uniref:PEP-CTERM sorting domain-containing protein n=1 Tax=Sphingomonas sp. LC-1 TaxID=3110957 RepID=UPI0021BB9D99|nr:PEP-CTERM sorting domain-containing protein [Sphingomonas sp. LC-1]MCT8000296.1 PEP-CTERM sorting domain-containing protein [Sphingomonas sp. LC-1]